VLPLSDAAGARRIWNLSCLRMGGRRAGRRGRRCRARRSEWRHQPHRSEAQLPRVRRHPV